MKKLFIPIVAFAIAILGFTFTHAQNDCNGSYTKKVWVPEKKIEVEGGPYGGQAKNKYKKWLKDKATTFGASTGTGRPIGCHEVCPDGMEGNCEMTTLKRLTGFSVPIPTNDGQGTYTYKFKEKDMKFSFKCEGCANPAQCVINNNVEPSIWTPMLCDNMPGQTILYIPEAILEHEPGMNQAMAEATWLEWIESWNGQYFESMDTTGWGCPECEMTPGMPCAMNIDQTMTGPFPSPQFTGSHWMFPPVPAFTLTYACGGCFPSKKETIADDIGGLGILAVTWLNNAQSIQLTLKGEDSQPNLSITVADMAGHLYLQQDLNQISSSQVQVQLYNVSSGIYLVNLFDNGQFIGSKRFPIFQR